MVIAEVGVAAVVTLGSGYSKRKQEEQEISSTSDRMTYSRRDKEKRKGRGHDELNVYLCESKRDDRCN